MAKAKRITLYTKAKCPHCKTAQRYLDEQGISYRLIDTALPRGKKELALLGFRGVPVLKIGEQVLKGFSVKEFNKIYKS